MIKIITYLNSCIRVKYQIFLLFAVAYLLSHHTLAQTPTILLLSPDSSYRQSSAMVWLSGNGVVGSNSLDNLFIKKSILGGKIESDHLLQLADNMKQQNRAGFSVDAALQFYNFKDTIFKHPNWGLRIGTGTNYSASVNFSEDLFRTIYLGNNAYRGDTSSIGPLAASYQAYQKFGFGIFNKRTLSSITASFVAGQNYQSLFLEDAGLFTSVNGDSLAFTYAGEYVRNDSARHGYANGGGLGIALDFDINLPLVDHTGFISIGLHDVGFIAWNQMSKRYTFDASTSWKGVEVQDIFKLSTDTIDIPGLKDSLRYIVRKKPFVGILPTSLNLRFSKFISTFNYYEMGISILPSSAALPFIYGSFNHFIGKHFVVSERISFGGYSRWGVGLDIQYMPAGTWLITAGSNHLEGYLWKNAHGFDFHFNLAKMLRRVEEVILPRE